MLFTDIEGSTALWERDDEAMSRSLRTHDSLLARTVAAAGGTVVKHTGDGIFAVFPAGTDVIPGLVGVHRTLSIPSDDLPLPLALRMGLHCGMAEERSGDFFGTEVGLTQRVMDSCAGAQIMLTSEAASEVPVPDDASLVDLGVQRLRDLGEPRRLHLLMHPDMPVAGHAPPRTLSSVPNNLLRPLTPFVGRSSELLEVRRLMTDDTRRLVTITGSGGIGKSRLALQAAAEASIHFPGGVHLVQLSGLNAATQVPPAVASAMGLEVGSSGDPERSVLEHLRGRKVLLLLDGFDRLLPCRGFVEALLDNDDGTKVLVTSRERLRSPAESVVRLSGFPSGDDGKTGDGVRLFMETADRMGSSLPGPDEFPAVGSICAELHGNPLAIILASSWSGILSPQQILEELRGPGPLTANIDGLPARHTSLDEAFLFSWRLLNDGCRGDLCLLSMFRGSFTVEDARAVTGIGLPGVSALVDKSLVERLENDRFSIHPLVLDFVRALSDEVLDRETAEAAESAYRRYFCGLLSRSSGELRHGNAGAEVSVLKDSLVDIRQAWRRCVEERDGGGLRTAHRGFFALLGHIGGYREGWEQFSLAVEAVDRSDDDVLLGWLLTCQGWFGSYCRSSAESLALLEESVGVFRGTGDRDGLAHALNNLGNALYVSGRFPRAADCYSESLSIRRELDDRHGVSAVLNNLGNLSCEAGDLDSAKDAYMESLVIDRELGDSRGAAATLTNLGILSMQREDWSGASGLLEEALELESGAGNDFSAAIIKNHMIDILFHEGRLDAAEQLISENEEVFAVLGSGWGTASTQGRSARLLMERGLVSGAAELLLRPIRSSMEGGWVPLTLELLDLCARILRGAGLASEADEIGEFVCSHPSSKGGAAADPKGSLDDVRSAVSFALRHLASVGG